MGVLETDFEAAQWDEAVQHLPLVRWCAAAFPPHVYDDAVSNGVFGLLRAVQKFDPARGVEFSSYAVPAIRSAMIRGRRNERRERWREHARTGVDVDSTPVDDLSSIAASDRPDDEALFAVFRTEIERVLRSVAADDLDHRIVDGLLSDGFAALDRLAAALTEGSGLTFHGVQYRVKRVRRAAAKAYGSGCR